MGQIDGTSADLVAQAANLLCRGELVAFATETVYGLGARADDAAAVAKIYTAKGRPSNNPLIVHVADAAAIDFAVLDERAKRLIGAFWPGPLTLVLPLATPFPLAAAVCAGKPSVAVRCPAHPTAQALLKACAFPIAAPSANKSGKISPTRPEHVRAAFGKTVHLLSGGVSEAGLESTIVDLTDVKGPARLLRPGTVTAEELEAVLGTPLTKISAPQSNPTAPGQLASHYAPSKPVVLNQTQGSVTIGFGATPCTLNLSPSGDLKEAATNLFALLHQADALPVERISVAPIPTSGAGLAINDRLKRAAAPRPSPEDS